MHDFLLPSSKTSRLLNSRRHPDQAAALARVPLLGRRIPMRDYWRHQPIKPERVRRQIGGDFTDAVRDAAFSARMGARRLVDRGREMGRERRHRMQNQRHGQTSGMHRGKSRSMRGGSRMDAMRERWSNRPRLGIPMVIAGSAFGLFVMYMFDPGQGRRRRALVRDQIVHMKNVMTRDVPNRVEKRGRFFRGVARGIVHETTDALTFNGHPIVDNETLVARVRSEVLRDAGIKAGEIHVDAYEGCVTLRGQLEHPDAIRRLVRDTAHVEGVREVRNFLHLPGTPPPNKASVYVRYEDAARVRS